MKTQLLRVALEGMAAGLVVVTPLALFGGGELSVPMQPSAYVSWFAVSGLMGLLNSLTLYVINALVARALDSE